MYIYKNGRIKNRDTDDYLDDALTIHGIAIASFKLIEDNNIDIDSIEELNIGDLLNNKITRNKINKLVQAVKQLNKEIKSIKEK